MARAKDRDALQTILRRVGDLTLEECGPRVGRGLLGRVDAGEAGDGAARAQVRVAGEERYIAAEDAGLYRDALGVPPPAGLPESFLELAEEAMVSLTRRYAATHGPSPPRQLAARYGVDPSPALRELEAGGDLVRGELLPGGTEREWCDADVLRAHRRASLARLRKEVEAADRRSWPASCRAGRTWTRTAPGGRARPPARRARAAQGSR